MSIKDVGTAQVRPKLLGNLRPSHQLRNGKEAKKLGVQGNLRVARVAVDTVKEVVLLVVVRRQNGKVDDALEDLSCESVKSYTIARVRTG